jgi:UDP-glucuronate decarboxylase
MQGDQFELIVHDVCEPLPDLAVQEIWNFACPASPPRYKLTLVHTLPDQRAWVRNCLELARYTGARLFHASTSEGLWRSASAPQPEAYLGSVNPSAARVLR